jgi:hypothetical protein
MDKISEKDRLIIDVASLEKKIAELQLESANLKYKNKILQLYLNYGLTQNHFIDAEGNIRLNEESKESGS